MEKGEPLAQDVEVKANGTFEEQDTQLDRENNEADHVDMHRMGKKQDFKVSLHSHLEKS